jgi:hypothetical protein
MPTPLPEISVVEPDPNEDEDFPSFWAWIGLTKYKFKLVGVLGVIAPSLAIIYYSAGIASHLVTGQFHFHIPDINKALSFSFMVQIAVIFILLIVHTSLVVPKIDSKYEYGSEGQRTIKLWWSVALVSFLSLYMLLWLKGQIDPTPEGTGANIFSILADLFNNFSTIAFLMCFQAMSEPTKAGIGKHSQWFSLWVGCLVMLTFVEGVIRFLDRGAMDRWHTDWFGLLTGASAGIALAMFSGRVASPLLSTPISVIAPLYFYAIIQMSYGSWENQKGVALVMSNLCLFLKCYLSLVIAWLLTTKHLVFYMERFHKIRSQLEGWKNEFRSRRLITFSAVNDEPN